MKTTIKLLVLLILLGSVFAAVLAFAEKNKKTDQKQETQLPAVDWANPTPIALLPPQMKQGKSLMEALKARSSSREFADRKLSLQVISDLMWAAFGVNRPDTGKRTAPSAMNMQEISVYAVTADGFFLYDAQAHALKPISSSDLRAVTGKQPFVATAPLNIVYVADYSKMGEVSPERRDFYSGADSAFIAENVYLYCASRGLAVVVRAHIDREALQKAMKLSPEQRVTLAQTIGYPI